MLVRLKQAWIEEYIGHSLDGLVLVRTNLDASLEEILSQWATGIYILFRAASFSVWPALCVKGPMTKRRVHALRLVFSVSCADVRFQSLSQPFSPKIRSEQLQNTNEEQLILEAQPLLSFAAFIGCYHQVGELLECC